MRRHTRTVTALASALLVAIAAAGCSDSGGDHGSASDTDTGNRSENREVDVVPAVTSSAAPAVAVKNSSLGKMLVDNKGMSLYEFDKDTKNKSMCSGACAKQWPPFTVKSKPAAGSGLKSNLLTTTKRDDGSQQVTYNGRPLYHFIEDTKAGDTNGQGLNAFGAKWYVMDPSGKKITKGSGGGGGGGGY